MDRKDSLPFRNSTGFPGPVDLIHGAAHGSFCPLASPTHGASGCFNLIHGTCLMVMSLKYDRISLAQTNGDCFDLYVELNIFKNYSIVI